MNQNNHRGKREASRKTQSPRTQKREARRAKVAAMSKKERNRRRLLHAAAIIGIVVVLILVLLRLWVRMPSLPGGGSSPSDDSSTSFEGAKDPNISTKGRKKGVYTFLVVGKDVASGSTDTMLLLTYDTKEKTINGLNLPRDTMINTSARSKRLNAVYSYSKGKDKDKQVERGMAALKDEVKDLTGIMPDYYVLVEWEAIGKLVEALGGVEFEVPFDMDYDDPYQDLHIHQKAGLRVLDGDDAMQVIRHRKNNDGSHSAGDVGRLEIQQDFLKAVAKKCLQPAIFLKIPELAKIFTENVATDLSVGNILALAQKAYGMDPETGVNFQTAPLGSSFKYNRAALVTLDGPEMLEIINSTMNPYLEDIELHDLELVYRNKDGSFGVTSGSIADSHMARPGSGGSSDSKPTPNPRPAPEPERPDSSETTPDGDSSSGSEGTVSPDGSQETPDVEVPDQPVAPETPDVEPEIPERPEPQPEPQPQPVPDPGAGGESNEKPADPPPSQDVPVDQAA